MLTVYIKKLTLTPVGISVEFNTEISKVWHILPGSVKPKNSKRNKFLFPGIYDVEKFLEVLRLLPKINPKQTMLDFEDFPIVLSRTYRFKMYKNKTGKSIPGFTSYQLRGLDHSTFHLFKKIR